MRRLGRLARHGRQEMSLSREQLLDAADELGGCLPSGQASPLQLPKPLRYPLIVVRSVIDDDRYQKCLVRSNQVGAIDGELPFQPEVPFGSLMGGFGNDRNEESTVLYLLAD